MVYYQSRNRSPAPLARGAILLGPRPSSTPLLSLLAALLLIYHSSAALASAYTGTLTTKPMSIPMSPVPCAAIGPVYHTCCMHGTMIATDAPSAHIAANPLGRFGWRGVSHAFGTS